MISVIIPAHDEGAVLRATLSGLLDGSDAADELEIIVVCNGCSDDTAEVAREFSVQVIELDTASKTTALNAGDRSANWFPRFYVDADIVLGASDITTSARSLGGDVHAVSPKMVPVLDERPWVVRAFYDVWTQLPYCQSLIGSGVFGLDAEGRGRFDDFPEIIADDLYARLQFTPAERRVVSEAAFRIQAPRTVRALVRVKSRAHLGGLQLRDREPQLFTNEDAEHSVALRTLARSPRAWPAIAAYLAVRILARGRAEIQHRRQRHDVWERDDTTRVAGGSAPQPPRVSNESA